MVPCCDPNWIPAIRQWGKQLAIPSQKNGVIANRVYESCNTGDGFVSWILCT